MKLIIASNNAHKIYEIKKILSGKFDEIVSLREAGISHETVEDGNTFVENALKKAREICEISGECALADDSGICVDALDGAPGIYSARFAGDYTGNAPDEANNALLLKNLEGTSDRSARFVCCIACVFPERYGFDPVVVRGHVEGEILCERHGNGGFGYDPLFYFKEFGKTLAEVTPEEKNSVSHRANAIKLFAEKLKKLNIKE